jgi:ATP phosphoribosyltransferase regulatory subunit
MGLEHLGGESRAADAEVLAIAAECLGALGAQGWVLALGHVGIFGGLAAACGLQDMALEALRERVEAKDAAGVREALSGAPATLADATARLATLSGDVSVLAEAERALSVSAAAASSLRELTDVVGVLSRAGLGSHLVIDLGEVRGLDYYTGLVFRVYAPGLGFEVGGGGRYDALLGRFGRPMPAVGFMLGLDRVALLLERQGALPERTGQEAEAVTGDDLGAALGHARERRAAGRRVRFGDALALDRSGAEKSSDPARGGGGR